jgi:hypothetical protein
MKSHLSPVFVTVLESSTVSNCKPIDESAGSTASKMTMVPPQSEKNTEDQEESVDEEEMKVKKEKEKIPAKK